MALHLIKGPLNSGRTGRIRRLVTERARQNPVVVAPTSDARYALERELCSERGAIVGPYVTDFFGLAEAVAVAAGVERAPLASEVQRRFLAARATRATDLRVLAASAARPGFATALEPLLTEMRAAGVDPGVEVGGDRYLAELLAVYGRYARELEGRGLADPPALIGGAATALRESPDSWGGRPVFMHGFDDLSNDQLRLVEELARVTEVTVSLTYEDREALRARSRLLGELEARGGRVAEELPPEKANTPNRLLFHLERNFGEPDPPPPPPDPSEEPSTEDENPNGPGGVHVSLTASERGEAEHVARQIKGLVAAGVPPARIAVALRTPNRQGPEIARALAAAGVPVALETELPVASTATGQALANLTEAALGERAAAAVVRLLRGCGAPEGIPDAVVDEFEWLVLERGLVDADEALRLLAGRFEIRLPAIERLRRVASAAPHAAAAELSAFVTAAAERAGGPREARAARTIEAAALDLAELGAAPSELPATLLGLSFRAWGGPVGDRVRVASPYTLRATRVEHLFVCSLQEGEFPRRGGEGPFLSEEQRAQLGLRPRAEQEAEEMYLFQICLALPERGLWLSARTADAEGSAEQPSPFLDRVEALADGRIERYELTLADVAPPPEAAAGEDELARALAARGGERRERDLARPGLPAETAGRVRARLALADRRREASARPRPLTDPAVLEELSGLSKFGATTLESYLAYPYHWFIGHELRPRKLGPQDEPVTDGSLVHEVLHRLFEEPPQGAVPRPESLAKWIAKADELIEQVAAALRLNSRLPNDRVRLRRITAFLHAFLVREAERPELEVAPRLLEARFGDSDEHPSLRRGDWQLRGTIDRVDVTRDGRAGLIYDYKFSTAVKGLSKFEQHGVLQLPLYMAALRQCFDIEPLGGLYRPLRARRGEKDRGVLSAEALAGPLDGIEYSEADVVSAEELESLIEACFERADEAVAGIRAGRIDGPPMPKAFINPSWAAIDRRDRSAREEDA